MAKITILPEGSSVESMEDKSLLETFQSKDVFVKSSCGGYARCRDCVVKIVEGKENLNDVSFEETQLLGNVFHVTGERLSCQTKVLGPVSVDLSGHNPEEEKKRKPRPIKIRKKGSMEKTTPSPSPRKKVSGGGKRPRPFRTDHLDNKS